MDITFEMYDETLPELIDMEWDMDVWAYNDDQLIVNALKLFHLGNPSSIVYEQFGKNYASAVILVKIFGDKFDFSLPQYQESASSIYFGPNGDVIHRSEADATLGHLFDSVLITVTDECFIFPDGREFCTDDTFSLKFFINGERVSSITDYTVQDGDKILFSYDYKTEDLTEQLQEVENFVL